MRVWNDYLTREDLESEPGVIDQKKIQALSLNTYLLYIGDLIELGGNDVVSVASDQVEEFMTNDFMWYTHAMEGRYPDPEEITAHLRKPENVEARKYWTYICVHATKENWPEFVEWFRKEWDIPEEIEIKNEEKIHQMMEKNVRERTWTFREL